MILRLKTRESRSLPGLPIASSSLLAFQKPRPLPRRGFLRLGVWAQKPARPRLSVQLKRGWGTFENDDASK